MTRRKLLGSAALAPLALPIVARLAADVPVRPTPNQFLLRYGKRLPNDLPYPVDQFGTDMSTAFGPGGSITRVLGA